MSRINFGDLKKKFHDFKNKFTELQRKLALYALAAVVVWVVILFVYAPAAWLTMIIVVICAFLAFCFPEEAVDLLEKVRDGWPKHKAKLRKSYRGLVEILHGRKVPREPESKPESERDGGGSPG